MAAVRSTAQLLGPFSGSVLALGDVLFMGQRVTQRLSSVSSIFGTRPPYQLSLLYNCHRREICPLLETFPLKLNSRIRESNAKNSPEIFLLILPVSIL